jgi:hypothetical protein
VGPDKARTACQQNPLRIRSHSITPQFRKKSETEF